MYSYTVDEVHCGEKPLTDRLGFKLLRDLNCRILSMSTHCSYVTNGTNLYLLRLRYLSPYIFIL